MVYISAGVWIEVSEPKARDLPEGFRVKGLRYSFRVLGFGFFGLGFRV